MSGLAVIGGGAMGSALVAGYLAQATHDPAAVTVADVRPDVLRHLAEEYHVTVTTDARKAVAGAGVVVLAIRQPDLDAVCNDIGPHLTQGATVVSVVAGVPVAALEHRLPEGTAVVRAMPNMAALVGQAATAICAGTHAAESNIATAEAVLSAVGVVVRLAERHLDAVTALSGSGPAYVFLLAEALVEGGVELGLPLQAATILTEHMIAGAARLLLESGRSPAELRAEVTSAGGTTAAAVGRLEHHAVGAAFMDALDAAARRSTELGEAFL